MHSRAPGLLLCLATPFLYSQTPSDPPDPFQDLPSNVAAPSVLSNDRILGVIPNYQTVEDPATPYTPLRVRDKWKLFVKETVDPYTFALAAAGAGISQWRNSDPKYGAGFEAFMQRFGAAQADFHYPKTSSAMRCWRRGSTKIHRAIFVKARAGR